MPCAYLGREVTSPPALVTLTRIVSVGGSAAGSYGSGITVLDRQLGTAQSIAGGNPKINDSGLRPVAWLDQLDTVVRSGRRGKMKGNYIPDETLL